MNTHLRRLANLRALLAEQKLDGLIITMLDPHLSEYVPAHERRIEFLTGFSGSAGYVVVLRDQAAFFTDSRYRLQAQQELPEGTYTLLDINETRPADWLRANLRAGQRLGYNPPRHPQEGRERLAAAVSAAGANLVPLAEHPVDTLWTDRPQAPAAPIYALDESVTGQSVSGKRDAAAEKLLQEKLTAFWLSDPSSVCWLLNMRGQDLEYTPVVLASALLHADASVDLFIAPEKIAPGFAAAHWDAGVRVHAPADMPAALLRLRDQRVGFDARSTNADIHDRLKAAGAVLMTASDPCALPRACKNAAELCGMRTAHHQDGRALCRFLCWLDAQAPGTVRETHAAARLLAFRQQEPDFVMPSFGTISAAGPNAAIVHYQPKPGQDRVLDAGLFLLDSGGQYRCGGTTDVTRTLAVGDAITQPMRAHYTEVLRGHLALGAAVFPPGTSGAALDGIARLPLWQAGLNYQHGTGHGVGAFLGVHEGPQGIGGYAAGIALRPGMVLSNEPGYYRAGEYGIRIENLLIVTESAQMMEDGPPRLEFESLTLVPYDRRLIDPALLTPAERAQVNAYHRRVWHALEAELSGGEQRWLEAATAPI